MQFLKTTILGGLVFLVPVVIAFLVLSQAAELMMIVAEPLAAVVPITSIAGVATANFIALIALLLVCFLSGLAARTRTAQIIADKAEAAILNKLPGYAMLKGIASSLSPDQQAGLIPVLVRLDDRERIGLETERLDDNRSVVFFPGVPNAWAGIVEIVSADRIERLDISAADVVTLSELFGKQSASLLSRR